jgi:gas vesicle protein
MGKFLVGLIIGVVVGILAMTANPNLPQELRVNLAGLTALVMRNAQETAEHVGNAAEELAKKDGRAADAEPSVAPTDERDASVPR